MIVQTQTIDYQNEYFKHACVFVLCNFHLLYVVKIIMLINAVYVWSYRLFNQPYMGTIS